MHNAETVLLRDTILNAVRRGDTSVLVNGVEMSMDQVRKVIENHLFERSKRKPTSP